MIKKVHSVYEKNITDTINKVKVKCIKASRKTENKPKYSL